MTPNEYQEKAVRSLQQTPRELTKTEHMMAWCAIGLAGEAGETVDYIKKVVFHGHPIDRERIKKELGDVSWYWATLAHVCGLTAEEVMETNIDKLMARYPNGFTEEDSKKRVDVINQSGTPGLIEGQVGMANPDGISIEEVVSVKTYKVTVVNTVVNRELLGKALRLIKAGILKPMEDYAIYREDNGDLVLTFSHEKHAQHFIRELRD